MSETREVGSATTRTAESRPEAAFSVQVDAATKIGRFAVLASIGAGGMGQVFSAYDPQLDRRVAIKLLHGAGNAIERQRLIREAQALARLSHPNVVAVHEVGDHEGRVFVAMEFVEGTTLKEWIQGNPPGKRDRLARALELLLDAGRGISAAHAAGLVHRDVKPSNILVGDDGRVRVVDFGLARTAVSEIDELVSTLRPVAGGRSEPSIEDSGSSPLLGATLTESDKVVGTSAYMAPEQFAPGPIDQAADQFAFSVTAWETLFGTRPFLGTPMAILVAVRARRVERPEGIEVPAAVEAALRRGLAHRPSNRHRDLAALLDVLDDALATCKGESRSRHRGRRWLVGASVATVAVVGAFWLGGRNDDRCEGAEARFDGVWDAARKAEIEAAMRGTEASFGPDAWVRLEHNVDDWRSTWSAAYRDACEAAQIRGEQSTQLMDLRMACLDERHQRLAAYLDLLASASVEIVANADEGFATLPSIDRCADVEYVERRGQRSDDPHVATLEDAVLADVARSTSLHAAGDYDAALTVAHDAVQRAPSPWTRAHAHLAEGTALMSLARSDRSLDALAGAYRFARSAGADEIAMEASRRAAIAAAVSLQQFEHGQWWAEIAMLEAERSHDEEAVAAAKLVTARVMSTRGRLDEALELFHAVTSSVSRESPLYVHALLERGRAGARVGQLDIAIRDIAEARRTQEARLGPEHPALAGFYIYESDAYRSSGDLDAAFVSAQRAVDIVQRAFGADHIATYGALDALANVVWERGDAEGTLDLLQRARRVDHPTPLAPIDASAVIAREAETLVAMGRFAEALEATREALELSISELGAWHPQTALRRAELAYALALVGQRDEAADLLDAALASEFATVGDQSGLLARLHDRIGLALQRLGQHERAAEHLRIAIAIDARMSTRPTLNGVKLHANLCGVLQGLGEDAGATEACSVALSQAEQLPGASPSLLTPLHNNAGAVFFQAGRLADARREYVTAQRLHATSSHDPDMMTAILLANIAEIDLAEGELPAAIEGYSQSVSIRETLRGDQSGDLVPPLRGLAESYLASGRIDDAITVARRSMAIAQATAYDPLEAARARFVLAQALSRVGRRQEARELAASAANDVVGGDPRGVSLAAAIDAWLSAPARR
jgi:tetratricopeptide (TPR) repeat protein/predicted Ser/Thr protein kinase